MDNLNLYRPYHDLAVKIFLLGLIFVASSASLFLTITILRFGLLKTRTNFYIVNMCILNIFYNFLLLLYYVEPSLLHFYKMVFVYSTLTFVLLHVTFGFLLGIDCFMTAMKPGLMYRYNKFYKFVNFCVFLPYIIFFIFSIVDTESNVFYKVIFFIFTYFLIIMIMIHLTVLKDLIPTKCINHSTDYGFTVASISLFSMLPCIFHIFIMLGSSRYTGSEYFAFIFYFIMFLPHALWLGHPIIVVYMLGYLNKNFKMAYCKSFGTTNKYSKEELDTLYQNGDNSNHNESITSKTDNQTTTSI